jgi:hypothetical protein
MRPSESGGQIDLVHPASDFGIASSPTLAVVPPNVDSRPAVLRPGSFVGSGAYTLSGETDEDDAVGQRALLGGRAGIETIHVLSSIGGKSPVAEFEATSTTPVACGMPCGSLTTSWARR